MRAEATPRRDTTRHPDEAAEPAEETARTGRAARSGGSRGRKDTGRKDTGRARRTRPPAADDTAPGSADPPRDAAAEAGPPRPGKGSKRRAKKRAKNAGRGGRRRAGGQPEEKDGTGTAPAGEGSATGAAEPGPVVGWSVAPPAGRTVGASPEEAFDALHAAHARVLTRQAYLLCGRRTVAERAVAHAFRVAWERWPDVAVDRDPGGWVRVAAHEYALSPWHLLHPRRRRAEAHSGSPCDRPLRDAFLSLPRSYRRSLLLHDGLGLSLADTAAETEASTSATAARLVRARRLLAERVPELRDMPVDDPRGELHERLLMLADAQAVWVPSAGRARRLGEDVTRRRLRAGVALTLLVAGTTTFTLVTGGDERAKQPPARKPGIEESRAPGPLTRPAPGGGQAWLPELRSWNHRVHLGKDGVARPEDR